MAQDKKMPAIQIASCLLLVSGFAALIYQTVWMTSFRLIFGASTPATGAVLAIFMGGLGLGGWYWGRRLTEHSQPLKIYGLLEIAIACSAALSPFLLEGVQWAYVDFGGSEAFGPYAGMVIRLGLATLVMGLPVFCMGGTLPAMALFVTQSDDAQRQGLATIYGVNTIGSVLGALGGTFFLFEKLALQNTLWLSAILNGCIALVAWRISMTQESVDATSDSDEDDVALHFTEESPLSRHVVLVGAFVAGFVFFVIEMVWFRMSAPILGGTTYSFGLVLAIALIGIGLGSLLYRSVNLRRMSKTILVFTFLLEGLTIIIPYALGDQLAIWAQQLREVEGITFLQLCMGWTVTMGLLVLPTSLVAGFQFPVLVALRGQGAQGVSSDVGDLYFVNTCGAVLGSLAGGFGLMPLMGALGVWQLCVVLTVLMGLWVFVYTERSRRLLIQGLMPLLLATVMLMTFTTGPTAVWRHSGIGAGRTTLQTQTPNELQESVNNTRRQITVELEGIESPLGVSQEGFALLNSGKSDGNAWSDVMTMVLIGLTGSLLHPEPKDAFVIGLGSGQTAGWLAEVSSLKNVDVAELEPKVAEFAEMVKVSNFDVMNHPKINMIFDDGRTSLMASQKKYDLIVSQPSNPYRAGVSSFFTDDFYAKVSPQINEGGFFLQWLQGYEIDADTLTLILSTLHNNFAHVSLWSMKPLDYLLIASNSPQVFEAEVLRERMKQEPYKTAFNDISGIYDLEGFLALHEANPLFIDQITSPPNNRINTDDRNIVEYQFAKTVGALDNIIPKDLYIAAENMRAHRPIIKGAVDWMRVSQLKNRTNQFLDVMLPFSYYNDWWALMKQKKFSDVIKKVRQGKPIPKADYFARTALFEFILYHGDGFDSLPLGEPGFHSDLDPWLIRANRSQFIDELTHNGRSQDAIWLTLIDVVLQKETDQIISATQKALETLYKTPWVRRSMVERLFDHMHKEPWAPQIARQLAVLFAEKPFALRAYENRRIEMAQSFAEQGEDWSLCSKLYQKYDFAPQWELKHLERRKRCYEKNDDADLFRATLDLTQFQAQVP